MTERERERAYVNRIPRKERPSDLQPCFLSGSFRNSTFAFALRLNCYFIKKNWRGGCEQPPSLKCFLYLPMCPQIFPAEFINMAQLLAHIGRLFSEEDFAKGQESQDERARSRLLKNTTPGSRITCVNSASSGKFVAHSQLAHFR